MSPSHSPAVSYPLQRSYVLWGVWWLWVLGCAVVLVLWWWQGAGRGLSWLGVVSLSAPVWLGCSVWSWRALLAQPQGELRSFASGWEWVSGASSQSWPVAPVVILDTQSLLLIAFTAQGRHTQRFVLQRDWAPDAWADLRRAVYSSPYPTLDAIESKQP